MNCSEATFSGRRKEHKFVGSLITSQSAFACSKQTVATLEKGVKSDQSW